MPVARWRADEFADTENIQSLSKMWGKPNHALYFTSEKSAAVHAAFPEILQRNRSLVDAELKEKRVKALQDELEKLQGA